MTESDGGFWRHEDWGAVEVGDGFTNNLSLRWDYPSTTSEIPTTQGRPAIIVDMAGANPPCYIMEEKFDEVDQRRELVMNVTDYNNVRLWIFIVDNDNLSSKEETYIQQFLFQTFKKYFGAVNLS